MARRIVALFVLLLAAVGLASPASAHPHRGQPQTQVGPTITVQPADLSVAVGQTAKFRVDYDYALGLTPSPLRPSVVWQVSSDGATWVDVTQNIGAGFDISSGFFSVAIPNPQASMRGNLYRATITDPSNPPPVTTRAALLTVIGPLAWAPPSLTNPISVTLSDSQQSGGRIDVHLTDGQDYLLQAPARLDYPVQLFGGHNIVWIGGEIRPPTSTPLSYPALKFQGVGAGGGTVHVEGLLIDGTVPDAIEGGEFANKFVASGTLADATLQVENVRAGPISGSSQTGNHGDCIQQYGGWLNLRVDHFTCETDYQGFFLPWEDGQANNQGVLSHWDLRNVNLADIYNPDFQTLLHFGDRQGSFSSTTHQQTGNLQNVYLDASHDPQRGFLQEIYPGVTCSCGPSYSASQNPDGTVTWANTWNVPGFVTSGAHADYVPAASVGIGYVSPGYQ